MLLSVTLRPTEPADLPTLFQFQLDPVAAYQAAFMPAGPPDQAAYLAKYTRLLGDPTITMRSIWLAETLVGSIAKYEVAGEAELTYWLDRTCWGQGIATHALTQFLQLVPTRPLWARVAFDNIGSQRVLEKGGFVRVGTDRGFAHARQLEVEEYIYTLREDATARNH